MIGYALAARIWSDVGAHAGMKVGVGAAWAASSVSVAWLLWARGRSMKTFWWAFGGGMALRAATLGGLAAWAWGRESVTVESVLLSYVFALLALLLTLETRHLRLT